jgi:hypothetical protein
MRRFKLVARMKSMSTALAARKSGLLVVLVLLEVLGDPVARRLGLVDHSTRQLTRSCTLALPALRCVPCFSKH